MYPGKGFEKNPIVITGRGTSLTYIDEKIRDDDYEIAYVSLKFSTIYNAGYCGNDEYKVFTATVIDHCNFVKNDAPSGYLYAKIISNTHFPNYKSDARHND